MRYALAGGKYSNMQYISCTTLYNQYNVHVQDASQLTDKWLRWAIMISTSKYVHVKD